MVAHIRDDNIAKDPHPKWLSAWSEIRRAWGASEIEEEKAQLWRSYQDLSRKLATTEVRTSQGLYAQICWFELEFGQMPPESIAATHGNSLIMIRKGAFTLATLELDQASLKP